MPVGLAGARINIKCLQNNSGNVNGFCFVVFIFVFVFFHLFLRAAGETREHTQRPQYLLMGGRESASERVCV